MTQHPPGLALLTLAAAALAAAALAAAGCRTDVLTSHRVSGAPVTAFESVEIARRSDMSLADAGEVDLVERVIEARTRYSEALHALRDYYRAHGYADKFRWASSEIEGMEAIPPYHYLLDSELPRLDLAAEDDIPEANRLFDEAVRKARDAGHGVPALYNQREMGEALRMFRQLIRQYPHSDKIDDAAFYCGEILKEYYEGQEPVAVKWYERAWTWDPQTTYPARFQAAVVYDYRLHNRERALELYRAAIQLETNRSNSHWAMERIEQITETGPVESVRTEPVHPGTGSPVPRTAGQAEPAEPVR